MIAIMDKACHHCSLVMLLVDSPGIIPHQNEDKQLMNPDRIQAAIRAHRQLSRVYRSPERAPEWLEVIADLVDAETYFEGLGELTPDQALDYKRVRTALKR
jgi:hypothetical protein